MTKLDGAVILSNWMKVIQAYHSIPSNHVDVKTTSVVSEGFRSISKHQVPNVNGPLLRQL